MITKNKLLAIVCPALLMGAVLTLSGCASSPTSANTVRRSETGLAHTFERGEVIFVRPVTIEGESEGVGAAAGGLMGLALGNTMGGGSGRTVARVGGALAGAAAGTAIERNITTVAGLEISVELQSGEIVVVVQAADETFDVGDAVRVIRRTDGGVRVVQ